MTERLQELIEKIKRLKPGEKQDEVFQDLIKVLEGKEIIPIRKAFLELPEELSDKELKLLSLILEGSNLVYNYSGKSTGLSDPDYDSLLEYYKDMSGEEPSITSALISKEDGVYHRYPSLRGTLDKIYKLTDEDVLKNKSQKGIDEWVKKSENKYEEKTGEHLDFMDEEVIVMPKFDGVSGILECKPNGELERALTRGNTETNEAQDITHILKHVFTGPFKDAKYPYAIKTEIMVLNDDLKSYNEIYHEDYKNTRSIASSIINSDEVDERVKYLTPIPLRYSYLIDGVEGEQQIAPGMFNYPYLKCKLKELDKIRDFSFAHKTVYPGFRCDGSVIYFTNPKIQKALGREDNKQKFEVAFKFTEETAYAKVKDVIFSAGLFGRLVPVVIFEKTKMKGNEIQKASLGSFARFQELNLAKGDVIKILYDIIPYATFDENDPDCHRSMKSPFTAPVVCPDCGEPLEYSDNEAILYCRNKKCPSRVKGKILNYLSKIGVEGLSYATVDDFYDAGYLKSIEDIYRLEEHKRSLSNLPNYKGKKIQKIIDSINAHRDMDCSTFFASLGIEGLGKKKFAKVFEYMTMDDVIEFGLNGNINVFMVIPGIQEKTAKKLTDGIKENEKTILFLEDKLNVRPDEKVSSDAFHVKFTKIRDEELEKFIREHGGVVDDNFTKSTNIVVVKNDSIVSSATKQAEKNSVPIVNIDNLKNYILTHF